MKSILLFALASAALAQQPAPQLSLSANSARVLHLPKGWPLLARVVVLHSQRFSRAAGVPPLRLAPPALTWADAIAIQATRTDGGDTAPWDLQLSVPPEDPVLLLPNRSSVNAVWRMSSDATAVLPVGTYRLTASLEIKNSDGWNGRVQSVPVTVRVIDTHPTPEDELRKQRLLIQYALLGNDADAAGRMADELLKTQPKDVFALSAKAQLLELANDYPKAYIFAARAVRAAAEKRQPSEDPPVALLELARRLFDRMIAPQ
jgi:hypothetical protein